MSNKVESALTWATIWHAGQLRENTFEPYIYHCQRAAKLVHSVGGSDNMVAAALLHDVIEDCGITEEELLMRFGKEITEFVVGLSDVSTASDGNREARKKLDREHLLAQSAEVKIIKLADMIDNLQGIVVLDQRFAGVYIQEKRLILDGMPEMAAICPVLYKQAMEIVKDYEGGRWDV